MERFFLASTLAAVLLGVACSGDSPNNGGAADSSDPPSAGSVTATSTQPPAFAATPTRVALPARTPTGQPVGPLAVYSTELHAPLVGERYWPTREVRAFDTGSGRDWAAISYGGQGDFPLNERLAADRHIVYATERRVLIRRFEGGAPMVLYEAPKDAEVMAISVSHAKTLVAVSTKLGGPEGGYRSEVRFLDISSGTSGPSPALVVRTFRSPDPGLAGFGGWFAWTAWLVGDAGVMVVGAVPREGPGARATLFADGRMLVNKGGYRWPSPDGRYAFVSAGSWCFGENFERLRIVDALTDETLVIVTAPGSGGVFAQEWLPDSSAVLYIQVEGPLGDGCNGPEPALEHRLLPVSGQPSTAVPDLEGLRRRLAGSYMFELTCPDGPGDAFARSRDGFLSCNTTETYGPLTIGGQPAGTGGVIRTLGVIP